MKLGTHLTFVKLNLTTLPSEDLAITGMVPMQEAVVSFMDRLQAEAEARTCRLASLQQSTIALYESRYTTTAVALAKRRRQRAAAARRAAAE